MLSIGKQYKNKNNKIVKIIGFDKNLNVFFDEENKLYQKDGKIISLEDQNLNLSYEAPRYKWTPMKRGRYSVVNLSNKESTIIHPKNYTKAELFKIIKLRIG